MKGVTRLLSKDDRGKALSDILNETARQLESASLSFDWEWMGEAVQVACNALKMASAVVEQVEEPHFRSEMRGEEARLLPEGAVIRGEDGSFWLKEGDGWAVYLLDSSARSPLLKARYQLVSA